MDERDGLIICGCIILLAVQGILHARMAKMIADKVIEQDAEIKFLRATMTALSERAD